MKLGKQEVQSGSVMSHLMAGVSAALPFVIGGGILVALANMLVQFGLPYTDMSKGAPSFTWHRPSGIKIPSVPMWLPSGPC